MAVHQSAKKVGFLDNSFYVLQPDDGRHKAGMDAVILAAALPDGTTGVGADFGCGNGVAGLAVLQRHPNAAMHFFDIDQDAVNLTQQALELNENQHLADRATTYFADMTDPKSLQSAANIEQNFYDFIIANPPFNDESHRISPNEKRAHAHVMQPDTLDNWTHTANVMLKSKGVFAQILRPTNLAQALNVLSGRFGDIVVRPVHPTQQDDCSRILVIARKGSRAPLKMKPPLVLHGADGGFTERAENILRGRSGIDVSP